MPLHSWFMIEIAILSMLFFNQIFYLANFTVLRSWDLNKKKYQSKPLRCNAFLILDQNLPHRIEFPIGRQIWTDNRIFSIFEVHLYNYLWISKSKWDASTAKLLQGSAFLKTVVPKLQEPVLIVWKKNIFILDVLKRSNSKKWKIW